MEMNIVLMAGGMGRRLWPLSRASRPKPLMPVIRGEDGGCRSMVQLVWGQLERLGLTGRTIVVTSSGLLPTLREQIGADAPVVAEPAARDTFAAAALACAYLADVRGSGAEETVVLLPADHLAEERFYRRLAELDDALRRSGANLALIGVRPALPAAKYGYLLPATRPGGEDFLRIVSFVEKPDRQTAETLVARGALWNSGVYAFRLGYMLDLLRDRGLPLSHGALADAYAGLPMRSFDYEVAEKESDIVALPFDGAWEDLGTWEELAAHLADPVTGPGRVVGGSRVHLINELSIPVIVAGVSDVMVVASPEGILVCGKEAAPDVKPIVDSIGEGAGGDAGARCEP